eukprot:jgi/Mesvir1/452/Mv11330-RA.1
MSEWKDLVGAIVKKKWDAGVIPTAEVFEAGMTETMELMKRAARVKTSDDVRGFFEYVEEQLGPIDSYDGKTRDKLQAAGGRFFTWSAPTCSRFGRTTGRGRVVALRRKGMAHLFLIIN